MEKIVNFIIERETKGTIRYREVVPPGVEDKLENKVIATLYIRKTSLGDERPEKIEVTIKSL